jgi:hypothetical protein
MIISSSRGSRFFAPPAAQGKFGKDTRAAFSLGIHVQGLNIVTTAGF